MVIKKTDVRQLQYSKDGSPWTQTVGNSTSNPKTLEFSKDGSPWFGIQDIGLQIYVGSVQISTIYVGDTAVSAAYVGLIGL